MSKKSVKKYTKILNRKKRKIERRLGRKQWKEQDQPKGRKGRILNIKSRRLD